MPTRAMSGRKPRNAGWAAAAMLVLAACGGSELDAFLKELENGASCTRLFEIRDGWDSDSPHVETANERLRDIGCYSAQSRRTDVG